MGLESGLLALGKNVVYIYLIGSDSRFDMVADSFDIVAIAAIELVMGTEQT